MPESYIKAEIVRPKMSTGEAFGTLLGDLFALAFRVLIVWWFFAAWFPELGFSYWQMILPVYAARMIVTGKTLGRQLK